MICLPYVDLDTDTAYWVTKDKFYEGFDQDDFHCRDAKIIVQGYLKEWFHMNDSGVKCFFLPTVHFVSGKTQFISGRHRTAVLLDHLNEIPIAFAQPLYGSNICLDNVVNRPVDINEVIKLPDLAEFDRFD